ncbi:unnamed protein product [Mytilus edulis]|uniref:C-type lectin domain-containing protein n=1 Tax=Mytilus edulis TaxID=6550 RepID=A0A8S3V3B7_MYTED|nr:unnamed protein product [Mytilus edulis]
MAEEVDISEQTTHLCSLSHFSKTPCSLVSTSENPSKLIYLKECKKSVSNHLRSLNISYDENILTEGLLICLRVGIFRLMPHFTVCPYHRSSLGLNWKRKTSCVFPGHTGKSKGDRPISYRTSYALISQGGTFLPIGSDPSHLTTLPSTTRIHHSPNCAIIGGIIGGIGLILIVLLSLCICKTRKLLIFRKTFDADREILQPSENLSDNSRQCDINNYNNQTTIDKYSNNTNEIDVIPLHERLGRYENEINGLVVPRGSYTWSDAYDNCKANDGYLASDIGYNSTVDSQKSSSAWVGKVELTSKWLQIMGYLRSKSYENAIGNCMYSSCTTSPMQIDGPYVANCTSSSVRGVCGLGDLVEDKNIGWTNSLNECIKHYGTYFPEDFRKVCSHVSSSSWTNIFRQHRSFFYTISSNNDELSHRTPLKCASINIDSPYGSRVVNDKVLLTQFVSCNTRLPYFLCVTDVNKSIPTTNEKDVKNKSNTGSIIGGVVCGLIVLVVISIVLVIFKKRSVSMCRMKSDVSVTEEFSNNASASNKVGLETKDDIENQKTRSEHFSYDDRVNSTHLLCEKLQSGGKYEKNICENGSDHEIVDEADKQSDKLEDGSDFVGSINNAQDGKRELQALTLVRIFLNMLKIRIHEQTF